MNYACGNEVQGRAVGGPDLLEMDEIAQDVFRNRHAQPNVRGGIYGGQLVAQALAAADRTVSGRSVHSLHSYFLSAGSTSTPIDYAVQRLRDGGRFSARRITASQAGRILFTMECSYRSETDGVSHYRKTAIPFAPEDGLDVAAFAELAAATQPQISEFLAHHQALEVRFPGLAGFTEISERAERHYWLRAPGFAQVTSPALHRQMLAFLSDFLLAGAPLARHSVALPRPDLFVASLDHCIWFHRDVRCDDWLLFETEGPNAENAVNLARGFVYDRAGRLVATLAQEALQYEVPPGGK